VLKICQKGRGPSGRPVLVAVQHRSQKCGNQFEQHSAHLSHVHEILQSCLLSDASWNYPSSDLGISCVSSSCYSGLYKFSIQNPLDRLSLEEDVICSVRSVIWTS
jgi:hypothetical protein